MSWVLRYIHNNDINVTFTLWVNSVCYRVFLTEGLLYRRESNKSNKSYHLIPGLCFTGVLLLQNSSSNHTAIINCQMGSFKLWFERIHLSIVMIDNVRALSHIQYLAHHWAAFTSRFFIKHPFFINGSQNLSMRRSRYNTYNRLMHAEYEVLEIHVDGCCLGIQYRLSLLPYTLSYYLWHIFSSWWNHVNCCYIFVPLVLSMFSCDLFAHLYCCFPGTDATV